MIITPRFVALNYPRTGSTFVRDVLRTVHRANGPASRVRGWLGLASFQELDLPIERTLSARREGRRSQHGSYAQIPERDRGKPVLSVTRNPFDRAVSMYEHGFWRTRPHADPAAIAGRYPHYPELDFTEYLEMQATFGFDNVRQGVELSADVGPHTLHFIRFFWQDPDSALRQLTDASIEDDSFLASMPAVRFLHTEALGEELRGFLTEMDYPPAQTAFLLDEAPVNQAASRKGRPWTEYFTEEQANEFRHTERLLFKRFPEYAS